MRPTRWPSFSSRGPAGLFIKPDITAPGVQILAGATPTPAPRPGRTAARRRRVLPGDRRYVDVVAAHRRRRPSCCEAPAPDLDPGSDQVGADDDVHHRTWSRRTWPRRPIRSTWVPAGSTVGGPERRCRSPSPRPRPTWPPWRRRPGEGGRRQPPVDQRSGDARSPGHHPTLDGEERAGDSSRRARSPPTPPAGSLDHGVAERRFTIAPPARPVTFTITITSQRARPARSSFGDDLARPGPGRPAGPAPAGGVHPHTRVTVSLTRHAAPPTIHHVGPKHVDLHGHGHQQRSAFAPRAGRSSGPTTGLQLRIVSTSAGTIDQP